MKRIMFVDDSPQVLGGLKRMLYKMQGEWEMSFAESGREALETLATKEYDAIISDMRMPEMNGAQLLNKVKTNYPGMVRFILSGHSDHELIMQSVGCTHQYLAKPCEPDLLVSSIRSSFALRDMMLEDNLRRKIADIPNLPTVPETYRQLLKALNEENTSLETIANVVGRDVGMTTKILHLVNSAFFGLPRRVDSPHRAVSLLGLETIKALVLGAGVFEQFQMGGNEQAELEKIYMHSIAVGALAQKMAQELNLEKRLADDALLAGIMHDVGKPILLLHFPEKLREATKLMTSNSIPMWQAEQQVFGVSHAEIGAYLLSLWGEPDAIVEAVAFHHRPTAAIGTKLNSLTAVHLANVFQQRAASQATAETSMDSLDRNYLSQVGLLERISELAKIATATIANEGGN